MEMNDLSSQQHRQASQQSQQQPARRAPSELMDHHPPPPSSYRPQAYTHNTPIYPSNSYTPNSYPPISNAPPSRQLSTGISIDPHYPSSSSHGPSFAAAGGGVSGAGVGFVAPPTNTTTNTATTSSTAFSRASQYDETMKRRLDMLATMDNAEFGWFHVRACMVAGVGFFTDAYDLFAISLVSPMLGYVYYHQNNNTVPADIDLGIKISASVGTFFGQIGFGYLADKLGRKRVSFLPPLSHLYSFLWPVRLLCVRACV